MPRVLIVANRTVGGSELVAAVEERLATDDHEFHLMVPVTSSVSTSIALGAMAVDTMPMDTLDLPNERLKADDRLAFGLEWLGSLGVAATGEVITDADTVAAVCRAVDGAFDRRGDHLDAAHDAVALAAPGPPAPDRAQGERAGRRRHVEVRQLTAASDQLTANGRPISTLRRWIPRSCGRSS